MPYEIILACSHTIINSGSDGIIWRLRNGRCKKMVCKECNNKRIPVMKIVARFWFK